LKAEFSSRHTPCGKMLTIVSKQIILVHATNTSAKATLASLHPFGNKARLRQVNEIINFKERKVMVFKYIFFINSLQTFCENQNVQVEVLCYFSEKFRIDQISLILLTNKSYIAI
jgi:hypothetical protein